MPWILLYEYVGSVWVRFLMWTSGRLIKTCTFDTCHLSEHVCTVSSAFGMQAPPFSRKGEKRNHRCSHAAYQMWQTSMESDEKIWERRDRMAGLAPLISVDVCWIFFLLHYSHGLVWGGEKLIAISENQTWIIHSVTNKRERQINYAKAVQKHWC